VPSNKKFSGFFTSIRKFIFEHAFSNLSSVVNNTSTPALPAKDIGNTPSGTEEYKSKAAFPKTEVLGKPP
jgi:hypothetical protein